LLRGIRNSGGINAPRRKNGDINWVEVAKQYLLPIIRQQTAPNTIRGLMYILEGKGVLKKSDYNALDRHLTDWRLDGNIRWNQIADGSGRGIINDHGDYEDPGEWINGYVDILKNGGKKYQDLLKGQWRWFGQPKYVQFMSEKHAVTGTINAHLKGKYVKIAYNRGNSGWGFAHRYVNRLKHELYYFDIKTGERKRREAVHIWYLGDNDKYGLHMDNEIREQLQIFGIRNKVNFERIAVLDEQVERFNLPPNFEGESGYEIDALNATDPEGFRRLLLEHVDLHFDKEIHNQVLEKYSEKYIDDMISSKVKFIHEDNDGAAVDDNE
jgi:hypothetical protein